MSSKYWLKLYIEMLDDPKVMTLRPSLRWRFIETLLVAGELDEGGYLPDINVYAWRVRDSLEVIESDFVELADKSLLSKNGGRWFVTKFADRQAPVGAAERMRRMRSRQQKDEYYQLETEQLPDSYDDVTKRNADTDTDKIRKEKEAEEEDSLRARDLKANGEDGTAAAASASVFISPDGLLCAASGLASFPADQLEWIEVVHSMAELHGKDATEEAMKMAADKWRKTRTKDGRLYRITNLNWIGWAQEILAGGDLGEDTDEPQWYRDWKEKNL